MNIFLQFCRSALSLLVERLSAAEEDEEQVQGELLSSANELFQLCENFNLDDDILWQHFTCSLFSAGLDSSGYEVGEAVVVYGLASFIA